jgi:hypothetical protein
LKRLAQHWGGEVALSKPSSSIQGDPVAVQRLQRIDQFMQDDFLSH